MRTVSYLRWSPTSSPLRVEFPPALLHEVGRESGGNGWGVLYGTRHGAEVRVLASRRQHDDPGHRQTAWAVTGLYFCRPRGDVFVTEEDLERFLASGADVALVICGNRAGFFVRDADGSVDSLTSFEEFEVPKIAPPKPARKKVAAPANPRRASASTDWSLRLMVVAAVLALPVAGMSYLKPFLPQPPALTLHEEAGQVRISWNPNAVRRGGELEIADGGQTSRLRIAPGQSSATFVPQSRLVWVTLATEPGFGRTVKDSAFHRLETQQPSSQGIAEMEQLQALEEQVAQLQARMEAGQKRVASLDWWIRSLSSKLR